MERGQQAPVLSTRGRRVFNSEQQSSRSVTNMMCDHASESVVPSKGNFMSSIIYIVGLIVVVLFVLSFLGLR
jgi:small-conductance mechanosensitive channel